MYNVSMNGGDTQNVNFAEPVGMAGDGVAEKAIFAWQSQSMTGSKRTARWYIIAALLIVAIIAYSVWQRDWFIIGIVIVVSAILFWYMHVAVPQNVAYRLTPMGIYVENRFYPFSEMHSFWIVYDQNVKSLYIIFRKKYLPALTINIESLDPLVLKSYLSKKLPEQESRGENLIDKIARMTGL